MNENDSWYFGKTEEPTSYGLNNGDIENFKKKGSLVREVIQNSLDAKHDEFDNVVVAFEYSKKRSSFFPDYEHYKSVVQKCNEHMLKTNDTKSSRGLTKMLENLEKETHILFTARDKNTTGLIGGLTKENAGSNLYKLVYGSGTTNKDGSKSTGGSFGIGKIAPLAKSQIQSIFYSTKNIENNQYFSGKAILTTHEDEEELRARIGYILNCEKYKSYIDISETDEYGTAVHVPFYDIEEKDIDNDIDGLVIDVLKNFMVCIAKGRLEVEINAEDFNLPKIVINKENYREISEKYFNTKGCDLIKVQCDLLNNPNTINSKVEIDKDNYVDLLILCGLESNKYNKYIAMREQLMVIKDFSLSGSSVTYDAIAMYHGEKLNRILRDAEPPEHNNWYKTNIKDSKDSKYFNLVKESVENEIKSYFKSEDNERYVLDKFNNNIFESEKKIQKVYKIGELGAQRERVDYLSSSDETINSTYINGEKKIKDKSNKKNKTVNDPNGEEKTNISIMSNVVKKVRYKGEGLYRFIFKESMDIGTKFKLYVVTDAGKKEKINPKDYEVISRTSTELQLIIAGDVLDVTLEMEKVNETN